MKVLVLVAQLYLTLCDLLDCSLPGSSVHGISQARILAWVVISFSARYSNSHFHFTDKETAALVGGGNAEQG